MLSILTKPFKAFFAESSPGEALAHKALPPTQNEWNALLQRYGLAQLLPYESWDEDTGLFHNEDYISFLLEVTPSVGMDEETLRVLSGIYSALPSGYTAQYTLYASPDILPLMKRWANLRQEDEDLSDNVEHIRPHHRNENIFRTTLRRRVDYLLGGTWTSLFSDQAMLVRDFRIFLSINQPVTETPNTEQLIQLRESITGTLRSAGLSSRPVDAGAFVNFMDSPGKTPRQKAISISSRA